MIGYSYTRIKQIDRDIAKLIEDRKKYIRLFIRTYGDSMPVDDFFRELVLFGGIPSAIKWYMKAYGVNALIAKREIFRLIAKKENKK